MAVLLHLSDLHAGSSDPEARAVVEELQRLVERVRPELVVASGDLSHRNRADQHAEAASVLSQLGPPVLAVPGNHDIPALPPARFCWPYRAFRAQWGTTAPSHLSDALAVAGMCSVRPWLYQEGGLSAGAIEAAAAVLAGAPATALRVAVLHHHLLSAPWRSRKLALLRRGRALRALGAAGAELVLSGHTHQSSVAHAGEFEVGAPGPIIVNAPGLGRPRPGREGEARGVVVVESDPSAIVVTTYLWRTRFDPIVVRRFPRSVDGVRREEP